MSTVRTAPDPLTMYWVEGIVDEIEAVAGIDDEKAHAMEDELHRRVLSAVARGKCTNPEAIAASALLTRDIKFSRWTS